MISNKRFDIYEHQNNDGTFNVLIHDIQKLKNEKFDYTQCLYGVSKKSLNKFKKEHGINSSNSQKFQF